MQQDFVAACLDCSCAMVSESFRSKIISDSRLTNCLPSGSIYFALAHSFASDIARFSSRYHSAMACSNLINIIVLKARLFYMHTVQFSLDSETDE